MEAEKLLRECLAIREQKQPEDCVSHEVRARRQHCSLHRHRLHAPGDHADQEAAAGLVRRGIDRSRATVGEPVSLPDAEALAAQDPVQFPWWALGLVGARPVERKKRADRGIDGPFYSFGEAARRPNRHSWSG